MKIFTIPFIIILSLFQSVYAQNDTVYIDCPGIAGGTWTPANRYIARCDVFLPYDSVLTIQPGVKIEFQEGYSFKVEGQLNAVGSSNNRIEIKPFDGTWKGMSFGTPSGETLMNTSLLAYVDIDCGGSGGNSKAIVIGKHKITSVNNIRISNAREALNITGFATIDNITQCDFEAVTQGISFQFCDVVSKVQVTNCNFEQVLEKAVFISQNQAFLSEIQVTGCNFDNSGLENNLSESAVYITLNNKLTSVSLENNDFKAFSLQDNSTACIYIFDNDILDEVSLEQNEVSLSGGESPTSPNADFGGLYINESNKVFLDGNNFTGNTGKKSGAGYLKAARIYFTDNDFLNNRNNYTGNENYAGAVTILAGDRVEFDGDNFDNNVSAKSGGAMYIQSKSNSNPIDLLFNTTTLENNGASNEGGAILINATLDSLGISGSTISGNFSSAGSGGCFSIISSAFNDLALESNTIQDNFVSENSDGGFLYLRHDPSLVPEYGNISLSNNICSVTSHNSNSNYSLIYSVIKSFPESIRISGDNVSNFYPVEGNLYHFGLLESGPEPSDQNISLVMEDNEFQGNQCPVFYFDHDLATISADLNSNMVEGNNSTFGTFLTVLCKEATDLSFEEEQYSNLISGSSGGAVSVTAVREIGAVTMVDVLSEECYCIEGNGGHFAFVSGSSNPASAQSISVTNAGFVNETGDDESAGNGGAIYYYTPGNLAAATFSDCYFSSLRTEHSGGAVYFEASSIGDVSLLGTEFDWIFSNEGDGAFCLKAYGGNVSSISLIPDTEEGVTFIDCHGQLNGGALSVTASGEIGSILIDQLVSIDCSAWEGNGSHLYFLSQGSDPAVTQTLSLTGSSFETVSLEPSGDNGGAIYFKTGGDLSMVDISNTSFENIDVSGNGGGLFFEAQAIGTVDIFHSGFYGLDSRDASGGAVFLNALNGNLGQMDISQAQINGCTARLHGGGFYLAASGEIGSVTLDSVSATGNLAKDGNGGHFAFSSASSNPGFAQTISIINSEFDNTAQPAITGGNGGAFYCLTPGELSSFDITASRFSGLKATGNAGAIYACAAGIGDVSVLGSLFDQNTSLDTAGAIYLGASSGNIGMLQIAPLEDVPTTFTSCSSKYDGGALCAVASREIGSVGIDSVEITKCFSDDGNGGHLSFISLGADAGLAQQLAITGSVFSNEGISSITGGNGGMIYYSAASDLASVSVASSEFSNAKAVKDGGSFYLNAAKVTAFDIVDSRFSSSISAVMSGGAVYVKTTNGLIGGNLASNRFLDCTSSLMGGSVYIEDAKFDNSAESIAWMENTYRRTSQEDVPDIGGAIYCKGINDVSFESDSVISQASGDKGGFVYLEKVYRSLFDSVYTYSNTSGTGGVLYHNGDAQSAFDQSSQIFNSTFLFNTAELTGGCFYISGIGSVEIGKEGFKNAFVANQSLSAVTSDQVGGGVLFVQDAENLAIGYNSFYVNKSENNGGIGIISNVSSSLDITGNSFLSNQAKAGGAFTFINSFGDGVIAENMFSHNSATEQAGALLFSPAVANDFLIRDNTFFKNNTGKLGGAIASYRPVSLIRNLFRENYLTDINPNVVHKGTTVYLSGNGCQALLKNCVLDQNFYEQNPLVASVYFDALQGEFPGFNIANCSFFNFDEDHLSVYNGNGQDTVVIQNSIFTQRQNISRSGVVYFNETVIAKYSDLIYSEINDPVNHNVDEYVYFNIGDYYFDSTQYPVDQGNPDPSFNDFHMPPAYGTVRNDQGISGGPDNPDTNGVFIFHEPVNLPTNFEIVVLSHDCFTYTFECRGEFVNTYEFFYWFMPDSIIRTVGPVITYTFGPDTYGNVSITALGHDLSNADIYGFGQYVVNMDIIRINSLKTSYDNNLIPVPSVPFNFTIESDIYHENDTPYSWDWTVVESQGVDFTMTGFETVNSIDIQKITALPASMVIKYTLEACGRVLENTVSVTLQTTDLWGYPQISFFPEAGGIADTTSDFRIEFDRIMTMANGNLLANSDLDAYISVNMNPVCPGIVFNKTIEYTTSRTIVYLEAVNAATQQPDTLCNGEYTIEVDCSALYTQFYGLSLDDASKTYTVSNNAISDIPGKLQAAVFPNPFHDILHITFSERDDYFIEVLDLEGRVQKSEKFSRVSEVNLNLTALSAGVYILRAQNTRGTVQINLKINKINN